MPTPLARHGNALPADFAWPAAGALAALIAGLLTAYSPYAALAITLLLGGAIVWVLLGPETIVAGLLLLAWGLVPFVNPELVLPGDIPLWTAAFGGATAVALVSWVARQATNPGAVRFQPSILLGLVGVMLIYGGIRLVAAEPLVSPATTARLAAFAPAILTGYLMFSQPQAVAGMRRALPLAFGTVAIWAIAYIAGATGQCGSCVDVVQSVSERPGLAGDASRLYTAGQETFNGLAVLAVALALARTSAVTLAIAALALLNVALQASRAQYFGIAVALLVLLAWRLRHSQPSGRLVLITTVAFATFVIVTSSVGDRALSGYQELRSTSGNAGYRLRVLDQARETWTVFGQGVGVRVADEGFNFDLGLPNTLLALGYLGAVLQLLVIVGAIVRGMRVGGAVGTALAAVFVFVLVGRPSLPLLEYGPSAIAYGFALGAICALPMPPRVRATDA